MALDQKFAKSEILSVTGRWGHLATSGCLRPCHGKHPTHVRCHGEQGHHVDHGHDDGHDGHDGYDDGDDVDPVTGNTLLIVHGDGGRQLF